MIFRGDGMSKKWLINRRTVLKTALFSLPLPLLDVMIFNKKAYAQSNNQPNLILDLYPNGFYSPDGGAPSYLIDELNKIRSVTDKVSVISGLRHPGRDEGTLGTPHHQNYMSFLSCAGYKNNKNSNTGFTKTFDQVIVDENSIYANHAIRTLALNGGDTVKSDVRPIHEVNLSWINQSTPVDSISDPRKAFDKINSFVGSANNTATAGDDNAAKLDILGAIKDQRDKLSRIVSTEDRRRLDAYYTGLDEVLKSFNSDPIQSTCSMNMTRPGNTNYLQKIRAMQDLSTLALQCGLTKVVTLKRDTTSGDNFNLGFLGINKRFHDISHYLESGGSSVSDLQKVNSWITNDFKSYCTRMNGVKDPLGQSLLDNSLLVHGCWQGDSQRHRNEGLVVTLVGGAAGRLKLGKNINEVQNLSNLWLTIINAFGKSVSSFGKVDHKYGISDRELSQLKV